VTLRPWATATWRLRKRLRNKKEQGRDPRHNAVVGQLLWSAVSRYRKRIVRYLQRTRDHGLVLRGGQNLQLAVWSDSGWAECKDTRKCTPGLVVTLGSSVT
jgi:hypothetical protein